jgi:hypothetical protein
VVLVSVALISSGVIAGNGPLVNHMIRRDRVRAEERVQALYQAAARAVAECGAVDCAIDSARLRSHYRGPSFSDEQWQGMTRDLLRGDGYQYQIYLSQPPARGVVVSALPTEYYERVREGLCLDDSGRMQCPLAFSGERECAPCESEKR